ncbi:MAG: protein kinase, partial [Deltaproteobacteria bacterium]|nr:protein kinase [Deltaproteobacteria bacterium]
MTSRVGKILGGKYRLTELIGKGGMGAVFAAEHTVLSKRVAVKLLHPEYAGDSEIVARFVREAQAASAIGHPNIIEVHDVGEDDGATFIVMELLEGTSLSALIKRQGRLDPEHVVAIARQIADALIAAHDKGVVHRDLKADNVFLTYDPRLGEQVKLLDFGISKVVEPDGAELTQTGAVLGTPHYMAPEQVRGEKGVDARIDVWALGVMIYQMLTGEFPFPGTGTAEVLARILTEPMVPLESPELPDDLVEVAERALEKDRRARFGSAAELKAALEPLEGRSPSQPADRSELELAETLATPSGPRGPTAPTSSSRRDEATRLPPAPIWKRVLWYLITLPLCWVGLRLVVQPGDIRENLAVPLDAPVAFVIGIFIASGIALMVGAFFVERFWALGRWNRFLQGPWFIVFPVIGLLIALYHFFTLGGQMESHLLALRSYAEIAPEHAARISELIGRSKAAFLSGAGVDFSFVFQLSQLILLGYVFVRGRKGPKRERLRWLLLPGGLLAIVAVELLSGETLEFMGPFRFVLYLVWLLTAVALIRSGRTRVRGVQPGWHMLASGGISVASFMGLHVALGYTMESASVLAKSLKEMSPATREWFYTAEVNPIMTEGVAVLWALIIALFVALGIVCRKSLPLAGLKRVVVSFCTIAVAGVLAAIVLVAMQQAGQQWTVHKFARMQPVTSGDRPFYIDREPESLQHGADGLYEALTGVCRLDYDETALVGALEGSSSCEDIVQAEPARCVTAIEARLYCEVNGKRLPTPEEWEFALGEVQHAEEGDLRRG